MPSGHLLSPRIPMDPHERVKLLSDSDLRLELIQVGKPWGPSLRPQGRSLNANCCDVCWGTNNTALNPKPSPQTHLQQQQMQDPLKMKLLSVPQMQMVLLCFMAWQCLPAARTRLPRVNNNFLWKLYFSAKAFEQTTQL